MNCPSCQTANRAGAKACVKCALGLPRTCASCGVLLDGTSELCPACRTERVPAALGIDMSDDTEILEDHDFIEEPGRYPAATLFVGRRAPRERLRELVEQVARGEVAFVALIGEAGIGKSRLVEELAKDPGVTGARVLVGKAGGADGAPFAAFEGLLRQRFGVDESIPPDAARARFGAGVLDIVPGRRGSEVSSLLAPLLGLSSEPTSESTPARTFIAIKTLLAADAHKGPLVLVIDELERASPETVNLVQYLAAGLGSAKVMLLCVARPSLFDAHPTFGEGDVPLFRLELGPLSGEESVQLFGELCRPAGEVPAELLAHVKERMGGVPRALTELLGYLIELGAIAPEGEHWKIDRERLGGKSLPDDLGSTVAARLSVMAPGERDLLEKAAACGESFWLDAVVMLVRAAAAFSGEQLNGPTLAEVIAAGDRTRHEVEAALADFCRRGVLEVEPHPSIPGEREYRFAYPPWWDVVYGGIAGDKKSRYHRLIAQWLELRPAGRGEEAQEEIGRHLERSGAGDAAALRYRRAGDAARGGFLNDKAVRLYDAALRCLGPSDLVSRIHLWHDLGSVFQLKGEFDSALGAYEKMLSLAWVVASRAKAAVAFNKIGRIHRQKGELSLALSFLERGLTLFEQADDTRGIAGSLDDIGQVLWLMARYDDALDRSARALETRRRLGDKRAIAASLYNIGNIERHRGLFDEAESCYREARELRRGLDDQAGLAQVENQLGVLAFQRGDVDSARPIWERALASAERIGDLPLSALLLYHLGEAARAEGHRAEAKKRFEAALGLARDLDDRRLLSHTTRALGLVDLAEGDGESARARCQAALEIAQKSGIRLDEGRALLALGEVHAATLFDTDGRSADGVATAKAEDYFADSIKLFRAIGNEAELGAALDRLGKYRVERGDVAGGKVLLTEAEAIFRRVGIRAGDAVRRMLGEL